MPFFIICAHSANLFKIYQLRQHQEWLGTCGQQMRAAIDTKVQDRVTPLSKVSQGLLKRHFTVHPTCVPFVQTSSSWGLFAHKYSTLHAFKLVAEDTFLVKPALSSSPLISPPSSHRRPNQVFFCIPVLAWPISSHIPWAHFQHSGGTWLDINHGEAQKLFPLQRPSLLQQGSVPAFHSYNIPALLAAQNS